MHLLVNQLLACSGTMTSRVEPRGRLACAVLSLGLLALLHRAFRGDDSVSDTTCPPCDTTVCPDGLPGREMNHSCCACPPEGWAMYDDKYSLYTPPAGTRTVRLYYTPRPGEVTADEIYGTTAHPMRFPPAYQAFPHAYAHGVQLDDRLGNIGGVNPSFNGINDYQLGYPVYDSWLTLGDDSGMYMMSMYYADIDFDGWNENRELLAPDGRVGFSPGAAPSAPSVSAPVLVAQVTYNASYHGPAGYATAWLAGPTTAGGRWSYAARWDWDIDAPAVAGR